MDTALFSPQAPELLSILEFSTRLSGKLMHAINVVLVELSQRTA